MINTFISSAVTDDYANTTATTGVVTVGGQVTGNIELVQDEDWFKVSLVAGTTYLFDLRGSDGGGGTLGAGSAEAYLQLYGPGGVYTGATAYNGGTGGDPLMSYVPTVSGQYYLSVSDLSRSGTGTYTLSVSTPAVNTMDGTARDDNLIGTLGTDYIDGGAGNDTLDGGAGVDTLIGGTGNDTYLLDIRADVVIEAAGAGVDTIVTQVSRTLDANVENLVLAGGATIGNGNELDNLITGNALNNTLEGRAGNDTLDGGVGVDTLMGGAGNDTFVFRSTADSGVTLGNWDVITDFLSGTDRIDLSGIDANEGVAGNQAFASLVVGGTFSGAFANPGDLYFDTDAHVLYANTDGDVQADFAIQLTGVNALLVSDLVM